MDARRILLLVMAAVGIGLVVVLVRNLFDDQSANDGAAAEPVTARVLVAARPLPIGTILAQGDIIWRDWPKDALAGNYIAENPRDLPRRQGEPAPAATRVTLAQYLSPRHVIRSPVPMGAPVLKENVIPVGSNGFVAAALRPGMRAVTIRISATSGVAGLIFPGDRVDLMLTHRVAVPGRGSFSVTETIIQNLRILALDRNLNSQARAAAGRVASSATFEVPPDMAQKIVVASGKGSFTLALRSLAAEDPDSPGDMPFDGVVTRTWDEEVSPTLPQKASFEVPPQGNVVIVRRGERTGLEVVGGALGGASQQGDVPRVRDGLLEGQVLIDDEDGGGAEADRDEDGEGSSS